MRVTWEADDIIPGRQETQQWGCEFARAAIEAHESKNGCPREEQE
jgi:hypothetical protein